MHICLPRVSVLQGLIESHLCPAFIIPVITCGESIDRLLEVLHSLSLFTAPIEQFSHLVMADSQ